MTREQQQQQQQQQQQHGRLLSPACALEDHLHCERNPRHAQAGGLLCECACHAAPQPALRRRAELVAQERLRLGALMTHLARAEEELRRLLALDEAAGDIYGLEVVEGWRRCVVDLADVVDMAYGETFWPQRGMDGMDGMDGEEAER